MKYIKETLDNGLRTIYVPMKGTKTVTVLVLVGVGSRYETKKINGISHFLEHMAFKGTEKRPDKMAIARELDAVGAQYNAYTGQEYTGYYVKADGKHAELAIDVVSDIFNNSTFPAKEIENEKGVILGEIDMTEDMPKQKAWYTFNELLLGDQPSGRSILGTKKVIRSLKRNDFVAYHKKHYTAENTVVIVAGSIKKDEGSKLIHKYFKSTRVGTVLQAEPVSWKQEAPRLKVGTSKFDQSHLVLGTWTFDYHDERRYALQLLKTVLGVSMSSRLFIKIRDELGLGYYIRGDVSLYDDYGFFEIISGVDANRLDEAVVAIKEELERIRDEEVESKELNKAFSYIRGTALINLESSDVVAEYFAEQELLGKEILTPEEKFSKLEKVTPGDVKNVAQDIFTDERLNLAVVGPVKDEEEIKKHLTLS